MAEVFFQGGTAFYEALDQIVARVEAESFHAASQGAETIQTLARQNATGRPGPNYVTGELWHGIEVNGPHPNGPGEFAASVVSSVRYGRAIEEGNPRWKSGVKYPYLKPAYERAAAVELPGIFERAWAQALRRGA